MTPLGSGMVPPLLNILRLVLGPALVFSFINAYLSNYGRNTRTTKTCRARTSCHILLHGYLCVYSSYGFIICVLVGNANETLGSTVFYYWCRGPDRHQSCQLSRIERETPAFGTFLPPTRIWHQISRILTIGGRACSV